MSWYDYDMGWWGYVGMGVGGVLFWTLLIVWVIALVGFVSGDQQTRQPLPPAAPSAEQILAARFGRGEISETEYRDRLAVLGDPARR
jgi:putative membrane protein